MYSNDALPDKIEVFKCMDEKTDCTLHEHFLSSKKYEVSPVGFFQDMLFAAGIVKQCARQSSLEENRLKYIDHRQYSCPGHSLQRVFLTNF